MRWKQSVRGDPIPLGYQLNYFELAFRPTVTTDSITISLPASSLVLLVFVFLNRQLDIGIRPETAEVSHGEIQGNPHLARHDDKAHVPP